ncbi:S-layer homology domain-containing protein [Cohnella sp. LGH]|uniref:S-layer homology domain-containing protein n=1 Tax=Cohnella sp. LGH TaxID=1619153 RepID=UPI001FFE1075|nr:S-layer homology domain-containing protein [Cohnella sp. LGH]
MKWAVSNQLLSGKGNGTLDPTGAASRAEVATIIHRVMVSFFIEPVNDNNDSTFIIYKGFTWDSPQILSLYKYLNACQSLDINVMLTPEWLYDSSTWEGY